MTMTFIDALGHASYLLYFASYSMKDVLWLRVFNMVAGLMLIFFYFFQPEPVYISVAWLAVFFLLNSVHVGLLVIERRPLHFTEDEERLYTRVFRALTPREYMQLLKISRWQLAPAHETLIHKGEVNDDIMVVVNGRASVIVDGEQIAELSDGHFMGEMSFMTGEVTSATVVALEAIQFVSWSREELMKLLDKQPSLHSSLRHVLGQDVVRKLRPNQE